jgi:hypothetical protein
MSRRVTIDILIALAGPAVALAAYAIQQSTLSTDDYEHGRVIFAALLSVVWAVAWLAAAVRELRGRQS